jgi:hypothetical protein
VTTHFGLTSIAQGKRPACRSSGRSFHRRPHAGARVWPAILHCAKRVKRDQADQGFPVDFRGLAGAVSCRLQTSCSLTGSLELVMMGETVLPPAFLSYVFGPEERQLGDDSPAKTTMRRFLSRRLTTRRHSFLIERS